MEKKRKTVFSKAQQSEEKKPKAVAKPESSEEEEEEEEASEEEEEEETEESEPEEDEDPEEEEEDSSAEEETSEEKDDDDDNEESKRKALRELLEPFGKDQIIEFLKEATRNNPSIADRITQSAESDPSHRKLFIFGLGWDATHDQVLSNFKQYGEIEDCRVVTDKATGRAKGYAFVTFKTRRATQKALKQPQKMIGHRMTSCQLASAGPPASDCSTSRKIYVGNVGPHISPDKLRNLFSKFGEIEEGPSGFDSLTGKSKGFALFTYKTIEGCKKALEEPMKIFEGCRLQCRQASMDIPKANKNSTTITGASIGTSAASIQQTDMNALTFGVGVNPGIVGANFNPAAAVLVGQNPGIGLSNPVIASAYNQQHQTALSNSVANGLLHQSFGIGGNYGINSVSPNVIGSYGSQAALQGLGVYQNAQLGHSSAGATPAAAAAAATRPPTGFGSSGTAFPSSLRG